MHLAPISRTASFPGLQTANLNWDAHVDIPSRYLCLHQFSGVSFTAATRRAGRWAYGQRSMPPGGADERTVCSRRHHGLTSRPGELARTGHRSGGSGAPSPPEVSQGGPGCRLVMDVGQQAQTAAPDAFRWRFHRRSPELVLEDESSSTDT